MLLGLIAILVFIMHESSVAGKFAHWLGKTFTLKEPNGHKLECGESDINLLFEKVHLGISANMGIYFLSCIYMVLLHWLIYKHWIAIDYEPFDVRAYQRLKQSHDALHPVMRFFHIPNRRKLWRLHGIDRLHALRAACIEQYRLPSEFQFSKYMKFAMRDVVTHMLEVHPICWAMLVIALLFTFGRNLLGIRVANSEITLIIYSVLSLIVSALSAALYYITSRIYKKVLRMPSVRRHLLTKGGSLDSSFDPSDNILRMTSAESLNHTEEDTMGDENASSSTPLLLAERGFGRGSTLSSSTKTSSSGSFRGSTVSDFAVDDSDETMFDTKAWHGRHLPFQIFSDHSTDTLTLMSVDKYRMYSSRARNILQRANAPSEEDSDHKSALFFRSRRFIVSALQVVTFAQTWLFGLSVYYIYSIYADVPRDPLRYGFINALPFIGPIITYALTGPTLSKIVKATYTGGLIRPDLLLEALFLRQSRSHPNASKKPRTNASHSDIPFASAKKGSKSRKRSTDEDSQDSLGLSSPESSYPSTRRLKDASSDLGTPSSRLPLPRMHENDFESDLSASQTPGGTDMESDAEFDLEVDPQLGSSTTSILPPEEPSHEQ